MKRVSVQDLAREYGLHESTVRRWPSQGCPARRRGKRHSFDPVAVEKWLEQVALEDRELALALARKIDSQARREARVLDELARSHIPRSEATLAIEHEKERMRKRLSRIPRELTPALVSALEDGAGESELGFILRRHAERVLEDLADESDLGPPAPPRQPTAVRPSQTVRQARTQLADLQAAVIDVRNRIAKEA